MLTFSNSWLLPLTATQDLNTDKHENIEKKLEDIPEATIRTHSQCLQNLDNFKAKIEAGARASESK